MLEAVVGLNMSASLISYFMTHIYCCETFVFTDICEVNYNLIHIFLCCLAVKINLMLNLAEVYFWINLYLINMPN